MLTVRLALDSTCRIPPERADVLNAVRAAFNAGTLGEGVVAVNAPGEASLALQTEAGHAAALEREAVAARAAEEQAAAERAALQQAVRPMPPTSFSKSPSVADAERIEAAKAEEEMQAKLEEMYGEEEPEFVVDFTMWGMSNTPTAPCVHSTAPRGGVREGGLDGRAIHREAR